jgi:hypothetical protein
MKLNPWYCLAAMSVPGTDGMAQQADIPPVKRDTLRGTGVVLYMENLI